MLKRYHQMVGGTFRFVDAIVIGCVWIASYWLRFYVPIVEVTKGFPAFKTYAALLPVVVLMWTIVFTSMRIYRPRFIPRRTDEVFQILKAHFTALILFIALTYLFSEYKYSRGVIVWFGFLGGLGLVLTRLGIRNSLRAYRKKGFNLRKVLAVGEGGSLETLLFRVQKFPELGIKIMGAIVQNPQVTRKVGQTAVIGAFSDLKRLITEQKIDEVVIALPRHQGGELDGILASIRDETVDLRIVPDVHQYVTIGCEVEDFEGLPVVNINESPLEGWGSIAKRATDAILAFIALIILSPFMIVIALAVKLTSAGPIFYKQERMGLDGKTFNMLKFRTMRSDAEADTGAVWATKNDQRKTAMGSFLRATSLDELPQFWNVLWGDMSLVGPRPERPVFVHKFRDEIPHYMLRHKVKAGITGWAQINGWRGNTSLNSRIEYDLYYIRNWSYGFDLKILLMTLWKGFVNKNAY